MNGTSADCPPPDSAAKRPVRKTALLAVGCRWVLAVVFLMAAVTKITDLPGFADQLVVHAGLSSALSLGLAYVLPWLELTCGLCLVFGYAVREAALLLTLLLLPLLGYTLARLGDSDCGCFFFPRVVQTVPWWWPPVRNLLLLLGSGWVAWGYPQK